MEKQELIEKIAEYRSRNNYWTEKTINQLGYSINLFTTVGVGFLSYIIANSDKFIRCNCVSNNGILCYKVIYYISIFFVFISIVCGFTSVLTRLYDFRITRHLCLTRKRLLSRKKNRKGLINSKIVDISGEKYCKTLFNSVFRKIDFINENDFNENKVVVKFEQLRKDSKILGAMTWKIHLCQILIFIIGLFLYSITIFFI